MASLEGCRSTIELYPQQIGVIAILPTHPSSVLQVFYRFCSTGVLVRVLFPSRGGFRMTLCISMTVINILITLLVMVGIAVAIYGFYFINSREVNVSDHDDDDFMRPME